MMEGIGKSKTIIKYVLAFTTVLWTSFIFYNSLQTAPKSLEQTSVFVQVFMNFAKVIYGESLPSGLILYIKNGLVDDIRNVAHIFEFFMLAVFARMTVKFFDKIKRKASFVFIYGLTVILIDETIQIFVEGRGFQVKDMILDSIGLILAAVLILIVNYIVIRKRIEKSPV